MLTLSQYWPMKFIQSSSDASGEFPESESCTLRLCIGHRQGGYQERKKVSFPLCVSFPGIAVCFCRVVWWARKRKASCISSTDIVCSNRTPSFPPLGFRCVLILVSSISCVYFPVYYHPVWQRTVWSLHPRSRSSLRRMQHPVESPSQIEWKEMWMQVSSLPPSLSTQ